MCGQHRACDEEVVEEVVSRLECTGLVWQLSSATPASAEVVLPGLDLEYV